MYPRHTLRFRGARSISLIGLLLIPWGLSACLGPSRLSSSIDGFAGTMQYEKALELMETQKGGYGKNNKLQFLLDRGMLLHLGKRYEESIQSFAAARQLADELYTVSLTQETATWLLNDYAAPYRGEDFELAWINMFQALNFMMLGQREKALVEAREVDSVLSVINDQYHADQKNVYKEDAFIRLLMGMLYEGAGTTAERNDAYIAYQKALATYEQDYLEYYGVAVPRIAPEHLIRLAQVFDAQAVSRLRERYPTLRNKTERGRTRYGNVYLIQYVGVAPLKEEARITIPLPDGYLVKAAFPEYRRRYYATATSRLTATSSDATVIIGNTELVQPIGEIAEKNLARRKLRFIAKTTLRAAGRYAVEKKQEESLLKKSGATTAAWFRFAGSMFNMVMEKADLRCWQTLPDQIRMTHLILPAGIYAFSVQNFDQQGAQVSVRSLGEQRLNPGEQIFLVLHTPG